MKPLIGITCNYGILSSSASSVSTPHMPQEFDNISNNYIKAVENAGGIPIIIPIYNNTENIKDILDRVDGVILSGGSDVGSHHFGERPSAKLGTVCNPRDEQELFIADYILNHTTKPLLGICRGLQVMNVAAKGTLHQDLQEAGFCRHSLDMYPRYMPSHKATLVADSFLQSLLGGEEIGVNSYHHQGIHEVGEGYTVVARSEDGVIEAVEYKNAKERFVLALQWHPEALESSAQHQSIFKALIANCGK